MRWPYDQNLRSRASPADERVVARHRAVRHDPHDLAEARRQLLRGVTVVEAVALRDEEHPIVGEDETGAEMVRAPDLGLLPVDHVHVFEAPLAQSSPGHSRAGRVALPGFCIRKIHEAVVGKGRVERDIEQATLATGQHLRHASEWRGDAAILADAAEPPRPFGHEQTPVREEHQRPGMLEALRQSLDMDGARHGRRRRRARRLR